MLRSAWKFLFKSRLFGSVPEADSLNIQYNEMISEVAGLIQESVEKANIDREIEMARSVQSTILPPEVSVYDSISVVGRSYVAGSCGGDWWYHTRKGDQVIVWVGDVTGHGVASALVASACRALASGLLKVQPEESIAGWFRVMNEVIFKMTEGEIFLTLICLRIDLKNNQMEVCNASHPSGIIFKNHGSDFELLNEPLNPPVGQLRDSVFKGHSVSLNSGESIFLMTDGLLDLPPPQGVRWNLKGLCLYLSQAFKNESGEQVIKNLEALLPSLHAPRGFPDDVTFALIQRD